VSLPAKVGTATGCQPRILRACTSGSWHRFPAHRTAFDTAVEALAEHLHHAGHRVDYGRSRDAPAAWSLSSDKWQDLIGKSVNGKGTRHVDWSDSKRLLASIWIWTQVTQAELHFSPLLRPDPAQPKPGGALSIYVHTRWPILASGHGHCADLLPQLDTYADALARVGQPGSAQVMPQSSWPPGFMPGNRLDGHDRVRKDLRS
jgi:hypothetical protein